jgi:hypothetical protein
MAGKKGYEVGQGIGKNNQGILNPVDAQAKNDKSCLGHLSSGAEKGKSTVNPLAKMSEKIGINMDLYKREETKKTIEKAQEK